MNDETAAIARLALDGLYLRQAVTANNIANSATRGFLPQRVEFEEALRLASQSRMAGDAHSAPRPTVIASNADGVALDLEVANASETALRYSALLESMDRLLQIDRLAISGQ